MIGRALLEAIFPPICAACGELGLEPFCRICAEAIVPAPPFHIEGADAAAAAWRYGGPVALAIQRLKYRGHGQHGRPLGRLASERALALGPIDVVIPVPLSRRRLVERGFNQARELARGIPRPVAPRALVRTKEVEPQVGRDRKARLEALRGAFGPGREAIAGRSVLILDDVVTTGATATEAVRAVKAAGAKRIAVFALAFTADD